MTVMVIIILFELHNFIYMIWEGMIADSIYLIGCGLNAVIADSIHLIGCGLNAVSDDSIHLTLAIVSLTYRLVGVMVDLYPDPFCLACSNNTICSLHTTTQ